MRSTRPDACSVASLALHEPLAGTASTTGGYLLLEHGGPWGRKAMEEAAFPDPGGVPSDFGRWLTGVAKSAGLTPLLVRRHGGTPGLPSRPVVMLVVLGGSAGLHGFGAFTQVDDVETIRHWDVDTLAAQLRAGRVPHDWSALATQYLVCTHGRRDVCCAELGRPVAAVLEGLAPRQVWEVSHLGGHRLAPNVLVVPEGVVYGRVDPDDALELVAAHAENRVVPRLMRGHAVLPAALQVSEIALRRATGIDRADGVLLVDSASAPVVEGEPASDLDAAEPASLNGEEPPSADADVVRTTARWADVGAGSGAWLTIVDSRPGKGPARPASCGAEPGPPPEEHLVVEVSDVQAAGRGAVGWDQAHMSAEGVGEPSDVVVEILSMLPARGTAVDVACGTGRHSFWLAEHGWQVTGVDYSRAGLRLAEREAARRGLSVTWELADARIWSPPRPFDLVLMAFVHLPGAVRYAIEWVAPGGHLVLVAHAKRNLTHGVGGPSDARLLYDPAELRAAAREAGFEVLRCEEVERRTGDGTAIDVVLVARRGPKEQQVPVSGPAAARTTR